MLVLPSNPSSLASSSLIWNTTSVLPFCSKNETPSTWRSRGVCWIDPSVPENRLIEIDGQIQLVERPFGECLSTLCSRIFAYVTNFFITKLETAEIPLKTSLTLQQKSISSESSRREVQYVADYDFQIFSAFQKRVLKKVYDPNLLTNDHFAALFNMALDENSPDMVRLLHKFGMHLNEPFSKVNSPIILAVLKNSPEIIRVLKQLGADLNMFSNNGLTAATAAVRFNPELLTLLHELGANLNQSDSCYTPLSTAVLFNSPETIKLLYNLGVDMNATSGDSGAPVHCALALNKQHLVPLLLSFGANPNSIGDYSLISPLAIALIQKQKPMIQLLQQYGANLEDGKRLAMLRKVMLIYGLTGDVCYKNATGRAYHGTLDNPSYISHTLPLISELVMSFFNNEESDGLLQSEKTAILLSLKRAFNRGVLHSSPVTSVNDQTFLDGIKSNKTTLILPTYSTKGMHHMVGIVLSRGRLFVCNRGYGNKHCGVEIYSFKPSFITSNLINDLKYPMSEDDIPGCPAVTPRFIRNYDTSKATETEYLPFYKCQVHLFSSCVCGDFRSFS